MSTIDYSNVQTIKIAPSDEEIIIEGNEIRTDFAGGIVYRAKGLSKYKDEYLKWMFASAIAMLSYKDQVGEALNRELHLNGKIL